MKEHAIRPEIIQPLLDVKGCARLLGVSPEMVERLRLKAGLPAIDLSLRNPHRRPKHLWRFDPVEVRTWWRQRVWDSNGTGLEGRDEQ